MLSAICFEQIRDNYFYGQYGEFKVVIMKDNGYINATKLCMDGGRKFKNWLANEASKALIRTLEKQLRLEASDSTMVENAEADNTCQDQPARIPADTPKALQFVQAGNYHKAGTLITGTYIHSLLVCHVACWISPEFAFKVSKIINGFIITEYKLQVEKAIQDVEQAQLVVSELKQQTEVKDGEISNLREGLIETDTARLRVEEAFKIRREEWHMWRQSHAFSLLKLNDQNARYPYYAIRCKRVNMNERIKVLRRKHPRAVVVFQHRKVPNGINVYDRLRLEKLVGSHHNYCIPFNDELSLLKALKEMCGADYPAEVNFPINVYAEPEPTPEPATDASAELAQLFTQLSQFQPLADSPAVIHYSPPSSPPLSAPIPFVDNRYFKCLYCNSEEPSLLHLYIHHQACMRDTPTFAPSVRTLFNF
jgi:hypothetical protein